MKLPEMAIVKLCQNDMSFGVRPLPHGRQVLFDEKTYLNLFNTGRFHWQGSPSNNKEAIDLLLRRTGFRCQQPRDNLKEDVGKDIWG